MKTKFKFILILSLFQIIILLGSAHAALLYDTYAMNANTTYSSGFTLSVPTHANPILNIDLDQGTAFQLGSTATLGKFEVSVGLVTGSNEFDLWLMNDIRKVLREPFVVISKEKNL